MNCFYTIPFLLGYPFSKKTDCVKAYLKYNFKKNTHLIYFSLFSFKISNHKT